MSAVATIVERLLWCNSHGRRANHVDRHGKPRCNPKLGGLAIPCLVVDLTDIAEIDEEDGE